MRRDDELLSAYVDGVSELTTEERRRVEELLAEDPALRDDEAATRTLLDQLRSLPPEGTEPDFAAMERAIRDEVGATVPRPWWRAAWRWLVPAAALTVAAAGLALWLQNRAPAPQPIAVSPADAGATVAPAAEDSPTIALWLDGDAIELDESAVDELLDGDDDDELGEGDGLTPGLLPVDNLAWIDELDVEDVDVAEAFLGRKKG
jgi:hypothetical protein